VLNLQPLCVVVSLPHASAETSNTDSNLKVGVLYGFFPVAGSGVFPFEKLLVSNYASPYTILRMPRSQLLPWSSSNPQWRHH
jgi:hypothetical protein